MKFLIALLIVILTYGGQARADCNADCQDEYQSEVNSCRAQHDDPDDADDLKACMDDAKKEYDSCLEECETEASSTDVKIGDIDDTCIQEIGRTTLYNTANAGGGGERER